MRTRDQVIEALKENSILFREEEALKKHTSFQIGGNCRLLIEPATKEQVVKTLECLKDYPYIVLGNGSNVLVSDEGFDGAVLLLNRNFSAIRLLDEETIEVEAGASLVSLCNFALEHSLTGLEFAYGIPATVGGALFMNAGAYGGEMKDVVESVSHIKDGELGSYAKEELDYSYRHSIYQQGNYVILSGVLRLKKGDKAEIRAKMDDLMGRRKSKQPLNFPSAGSTFKRPVGAFAAKLIEDCGLKGASVGGAQVSEKHSGFIINTGNATCKDVLDLIEIVKDKVKEETGFTLECEVKLIG